MADDDHRISMCPFKIKGRDGVDYHINFVMLTRHKTQVAGGDNTVFLRIISAQHFQLFSTFFLFAVTFSKLFHDVLAANCLILSPT